MEKKIKTLYILSIAAILAFLGMQAYWLYARYEFSLKEYEERARDVIAQTLLDYNKLRVEYRPIQEVSTYHSFNNLKTGHDSLGRSVRTATITVKEFDGLEMLGIKEQRSLTSEEKELLAAIVVDSLDAIEAIKASFDATSAPSDGMAWNAMRNFELDMQSPFATEGIDTLLRKKNIEAEVSLAIADSMMWRARLEPHTSVLDPRFSMILPYSELERKIVTIDCKIPSSQVLREMGWTLTMAVVLSLFLIICLVWQIKTIVKLTRLDKMRNSFIATMIHELKRPISTLKMCVSGFDNDKWMVNSGLRHELAAEMRIGLDSLSAYFSKLRDITFNNVEQIPLNVTSFYIADMVKDVLKSIETPSTKHVTFENDMPEKMEVAADRTHLTNIITNLVENAIKYSGMDVVVRISAKVTAEGVMIKVADNGNGISAIDQNKIFNRFYRGNASATDIPGIGLGLAYVRLLVDAHGGEILVESAEGVGSTFTIKLPQ